MFGVLGFTELVIQLPTHLFDAIEFWPEEKALLPFL
jgi:hypothetical protein